MSNEHESSARLGKIARDPDDDLKEALHELPYGMYVIGSSDGATPNAMIADWVMQVSFNPRLISVSYELDSSTLARIRKHKFFTVNLLNQENNGMALAAKFVQPTDSTKIKGRQGAGPAQKMNKLEIHIMKMQMESKENIFLLCHIDIDPQLLVRKLLGICKLEELTE